LEKWNASRTGHDALPMETISGICPVSSAREMAVFGEITAAIGGHGSGHELRHWSGNMFGSGLLSTLNLKM